MQNLHTPKYYVHDNTNDIILRVILISISPLYHVYLEYGYIIQNFILFFVEKIYMQRNLRVQKLRRIFNFFVHYTIALRADVM